MAKEHAFAEQLKYIYWAAMYTGLDALWSIKVVTDNIYGHATVGLCENISITFSTWLAYIPM